MKIECVSLRNEMNFISYQRRQLKSNFDYEEQEKGTRLKDNIIKNSSAANSFLIAHLPSLQSLDIIPRNH